MHLQVYVDTNVYLGLLATTSLVTDEMAKFLALCENGSLDLYLPQQTEEEYLSNREDVIARTAQELRRSGSIGALHPLVETHNFGADAKRLRRELSERVSGVAAWYSEAARKHELPFDEWFAKLKSTAICIKSAPELVARATQRAASHLPPGKGENLGDRLIWESLLKASDLCEDIHIITIDDKDYRCPLNPAAPRRKLKEEWWQETRGTMHVHKSINNFFEVAGSTDRFARATEVGRAIWILRNQSEDSFIDTAVATMKRNMRVFSIRQIKLIAAAARSYYERVFLTAESFDTMMVDFWHHYEKHLDKEEKTSLSNVLTASGIIVERKAAANSN